MLWVMAAEEESRKLIVSSKSVPNRRRGVVDCSVSSVSVPSCCPCLE